VLVSSNFALLAGTDIAVCMPPKKRVRRKATVPVIFQATRSRKTVSGMPQGAHLYTIERCVQAPESIEMPNFFIGDRAVVPPMVIMLKRAAPA